MREQLPAIIFSNKNFIRLWTSQILSQWSLNMVNLVLISRIYERTGSTIAVSLIWVFYGLPALIFGPFSGFFIDLWSKRKVLLVTNFLQALSVLLYLPFREKIYPLYSIVFLYSFLNQFYMPAEAATLPQVVTKKDLPAANSLFLFTFQTAIVLGFGFGGIFLRLLGQEGSFWLGSLMLFVAAAAVYYLPRDQPQMRISFEANLASFWRKVSQGYHFIHSEPLVFLPLALLLFFQVFLGILVTILPSFGREILAISVEDTAPLLIVPAGLGALAGIFLLPSLLVKRRKKELVEAGMILASFTLCLMGTVLIRQGEWRLILGPILTFLLGLAAVLTLVPCQTLIQEKTPASLRGRVFGALNFLMTLVTLPPLLVAATVVDLLGVTHLILLVGLSTFLIYLYSRWQGDNALIPTNHRS